MNILMVGTTIKQLRCHNHMTQKDLANRLGVSPQAVSKWENGVSLPDTYYLPSLAQLLGITIDELLNDKSESSIKFKGEANLENVIKAFQNIEEIKTLLGEDSLFYLGIINGINQTMNMDLEDALKNYKNILYLEAILQLLYQGYSINKEQVEKIFKNNYKTYNYIKEQNTIFWENTFKQNVQKAKGIK